MFPDHQMFQGRNNRQCGRLGSGRNTQGLLKEVFLWLDFWFGWIFPIEMSNVTVLAGTLRLFNTAMENHNF